MGIVDEDIERLRSTVSIVDTVQQYVALKRVGRNWVGLCPFHAEKSGSFNVREETGRYKCFGCDKGGDVFTFIQEIEHTDFPGAVEHLAANEPIDRGWYTGGIGWLTPDGEGEIAIGLRCGLINGAVTTLFAGAGIVADSDPAAEERETENKAAALLAAVDLARSLAGS